MSDSVRRLSFTALFVAVGVLSAHLIYIPVGIAKCFPVQHAINVLLAVLLGTRYAISGAFAVSFLRVAFGTGSLLAFPGSMFGAALAGLLYKRTGHIAGAMIGEVIGTGLLGGLAAYPVAAYLIGSQVGAFFFIVPFAISSLGGSLIAWLIDQTPVTAFCRDTLGKRN